MTNQWRENCINCHWFPMIIQWQLMVSTIWYWLNWFQISSCFRICKLLGIAALYRIFECKHVDPVSVNCLSCLHTFVHCYFIESGRLLTLPVTTIGWHLVDISFDTGLSLRWRLNHNQNASDIPAIKTNTCTKNQSTF